MTAREVQNVLHHLRSERVMKGSVIAIGNFDGVHLGHRQILQRLIADGQRQRLPALVMTFDPHPVTVFGGKPASEFRLTDASHRATLLRELGVDEVLTIPFNRSFAEISAEEFVSELLAGHLKARSLHVGYDFNFGKGRQGNPALLRELESRFGYVLHVHDAVLYDGAPVSSTRVRNAIRAADIELATALLGRPWQIRGVPAQGAGRGKGLGYPTINLYPSMTLKPPPGVYVSRLRLADGAVLDAITNAGHRPTFEDDDRFSVETFVLSELPGSFDESATSCVAVEILKFLREEKAFPSPTALIQQIQADVEGARRWHDAARAQASLSSR